MSASKQQRWCISQQKRMLSSYEKCLASIDALCVSPQMKRNVSMLSERMNPCKQGNVTNISRPNPPRTCSSGKKQTLKKSKTKGCARTVSLHDGKHTKSLSLPGGKIRRTQVEEHSPEYSEAKAKEEMLRQREEECALRKDTCFVRLDKVRARIQNKSSFLPLDDGPFPVSCMGDTCSGNPINAKHCSSYDCAYHRKCPPPGRRLRPTLAHLMERQRWRRKRERKEAKRWTDICIEEATGNNHNDMSPGCDPEKNNHIRSDDTTAQSFSPCHQQQSSTQSFPEFALLPHLQKKIYGNEPDTPKGDDVDIPLERLDTKQRRTSIDCRRSIRTSHWAIQHLASQREKFLKAEKEYENMPIGHRRRRHPRDNILSVKQVPHPQLESNPLRPLRRVFPKLIPKNPDSIPESHDWNNYPLNVGSAKMKHPTATSNRRVAERRHNVGEMRICGMDKDAVEPSIQSLGIQL